MEKTYYTTIGLEVHAELKTATKMFCNSKNDPDEERPNVNICPVCMAHPGALPVINKKAVEHVVRVGLALGGEVADFTEFDRKNYFYPDIPKGYQISQYKYPIVKGGMLAGVDITRVHLEEDTANSKHDRGDYSLIDYNRAGVPLMELVTEPVIKSAKQAGDFGRELQLLLRTLGVSEANMEKGEMRVELNISISPDPNKFGTKVEVKNINSFRAVERAAEYEIKRMSALLDEGRGGEIVQETRGWDENKQSTFSQRAKENSEDYRYFPDPDLPKLKLTEVFDFEEMKKELPELPHAKRVRYKETYGIKDEDIEIFITNKDLAKDFENNIKQNKLQPEEIKALSNLMTNFLVGLMSLQRDQGGNPTQLTTTPLSGEVATLFVDGSINSTSARISVQDIFENKVKEPTMKEYFEKRGMLAINDEGAIKVIAEKIIASNPEAVLSYKSGKENAVMSLVGQIMKESKGSANPQLAKQVLIDLINKN